ncbi:hypothetical protein ES332_A05G250600v1 [Gossypium tomentosum]|uniref:Reverse transcriptase RNase H-like domain-containing protein n=1 Tax=Gossypium tomentosum TaxID=34277 RepID=A0A5D2QMF7_GOSTO|nr:hypothetical protein ES332_A05G250600v1 [Gossypium tomentosum]
MEGWGGVCKWKLRKYDSKGSEKICAYTSGKFAVPKSTIDAEIYAAMETLEQLKIHYLDQPEITLRTDCDAIVRFFNKSSVNKPSRVRWVQFVDFITGTGVKVNFEHTKGTDNVFADSLSRLVTVAATSIEEETETVISNLGECLEELQQTAQEPLLHMTLTELGLQLLKKILAHLEISISLTFGKDGMEISTRPPLTGGEPTLNLGFSTTAPKSL